MKTPNKNIPMNKILSILRYPFEYCISQPVHVKNDVRL